MNWFRPRAGLLFSALVLLLATAPNAFAQLKVGYTDADLIISQMEEYRTVMQELQGLAEGGQAEYEQLVQSFQTELSDYQKKQALLSPDARATREQQLAAQQAEIQQYLQTKDQELNQRQVELLSPLLDRVQQAIDEVAQERGLDLVLSAQTTAGPVVLYASEELDITQEVSEKLGVNISTGASSSR